MYHQGSSALWQADCSRLRLDQNIHSAFMSPLNGDSKRTAVVRTPDFIKQDWNWELFQFTIPFNFFFFSPKCLLLYEALGLKNKIRRSVGCRTVRQPQVDLKIQGQKEPWNLSCRCRVGTRHPAEEATRESRGRAYLSVLLLRPNSGQQHCL